MKKIHNRTALGLSVVGGILMIASGASGTLGYLDQLQDALDAVYGSTFTFTLEILLGILAALTAIGGLGVIIGGWILTTDRVEIGRILIMVSVGMGILSLIMSLVQLVLAGIIAMGMMVQIAQSLGWIGAIFSIEARIISSQRPLVPPE